MEPRLHSYSPDTGALNASCIMERHRKLWGERFTPSHDDKARRNGVLPWQLDLPFGLTQRQSGKERAVRTVYGCLSAADFLKHYAARHVPVIMKGCDKSPAIHRWDDEYLRNAAGNWFGATHYQNKNITLSTYLRTMDHLEYVTRTCLPSQLKRDLIPILSLGCAIQRAENLVLWISNGGKRSWLHFDGGDFLLSQLHGQKRITLVDPAHSLYLYADFSRAYGLSPINPSAVDIAKFPESLNVETRTALLSPGDVLYIPDKWWHAVYSLPGRNIAYTFQTSYNDVALESHASASLLSWLAHRRWPRSAAHSLCNDTVLDDYRDVWFSSEASCEKTHQ